MLIVSYSIVLILALVLLIKDLKIPDKISTTIRHTWVLVGVIFALVYLGLWHLISFIFGTRFGFTPFPNLSGYESYSVYSLPLAFILYFAFAVFGAFVEEIAYRGYVQTRIASRYGYIAGILISALLFSLQHIHVFELFWIIEFLQTQFVHVLLFGVFTGYLYYKSKKNIWSVFAFHALLNIFAVSVPIVVVSTFPIINQIATIASFIILIALLDSIEV